MKRQSVMPLQLQKRSVQVPGPLGQGDCPVVGVGGVLRRRWGQWCVTGYDEWGAQHVVCWV